MISSYKMYSCTTDDPEIKPIKVRLTGKCLYSVDFTPPLGIFSNRPASAELGDTEIGTGQLLAEGDAKHSDVTFPQRGKRFCKTDFWAAYLANKYLFPLFGAEGYLMGTKGYLMGFLKDI